MESPSLAGDSSQAAEVKDLWFAYSGSNHIIKGVTLSMEQGLITTILGASGSGKTTLLKLIKGILRPQRGSVRVLGADISASGMKKDLNRQVAYIPQQLGLVRSLTVMESALTGALGRSSTLASLVSSFPRDIVDEAEEVLNDLGIGHKSHEKVFNLSGGERQRVAIARALMQRPKLLLADEFVSQLDPVTSRDIMNSVKGIVDKGVTVVMTTHELDIVSQYGDAVVVLRGGEKALECLGSEMNLEMLSKVLK